MHKHSRARLHHQGDSREILARHREVRYRAASGQSLSPHHVEVSLTIGMTTSLIERVALKGPLTHSAHMMLPEGCQEECEDRRDNGNNETREKTDCR